MSWSEPVVGPVATGRCTGVCDDDIAACFCNGTFANPELPRTGTPLRHDMHSQPIGCLAVCSLGHWEPCQEHCTGSPENSLYRYHTAK